MPGANQADANYVFAYSVAYLMHETLKKCGDDADPRERHEAGGELPEVQAAAAAAGHHDQHQPDRLTIRSRRSSSRASRARAGSCSATSCTPRAPDLPTVTRAKRPPGTGGLRRVSAAIEPAVALQRLAAFRGVGAAVLVGVAAGEVAVACGHELGQAHGAVPVGVERAGRRLDWRWPGGRSAARCCRRPACAANSSSWRELAVAVGVEPLEAGFLAGLPFGAVDDAVLVGVVAHDAAIGACGPARRRGGRRVAEGGEGRGGGEQEQDDGEDRTSASRHIL